MAKRDARNPGAANRGNKKGQGALKKGSAFRDSAASSKPGRTTPKGDKRVKGSNYRTEGTIKRLNMYKDKPDKRKMREQALKPMRIQPDRRWFGNTRVLAQDKMQAFRETLAKTVADPFTIALKSSKLPMSLLRDMDGNNSRMDVLSAEPFHEVFGKRKVRKRVKLVNYELEGLVKGAAEKAEKYGGSKDSRALVDMSTGEAKEADVAATHVGEEIFSKGTSKRIWGELYKVIDASDVIVEVLDARDPMGTRCFQLEQEIRRTRANKHIILVLNKVDLVPTWVTKRWVQVLMKDFPTLAFHASITNPFGKNALLNLLRQISTLLKERKHVTVGMVGYPNVGKSSVINTMKRKKVCNAAPTPGETKVWQYIAISQKLYLLDCPGIVPPSPSDFKSDCAKVLKGVVRAEKITTPSDYVDEVLSRVKKAYLCQRYRLPIETAWENAEEFLSILGKKMGKLYKGGDPDIEITARIVLYDWQRGRLPFFTPPPQGPDQDAREKATKEPQASSEGEKPAAIADGEAPPDAHASPAALGPAGDAETDARKGAVTPAVEQSFGDLMCVSKFDEEDLRGEQVGEAGDEDDEDGEEPTGKVAKGTKRQAEAKASGKKSKRRRRSAGTVPPGDTRRAVLPAHGSVDWQKVVSEFAM
mmetsp:Transcript_25966/g.68097  ORF Transcript_25966/g.68097 Transcript_25966/m.68097 type:complete len:645 (-) Transcript_25966:171-2105(-)